MVTSQTPTSLEGGQAKDKNARVFVGGPIKAGFRNGQFDPVLRRTIERVTGDLVGSGFTVVNAHEREQFAPVDNETRAHLARRDHDWLRECDVHVVVLPLGHDRVVLPSFGTAVEIGWSLSVGRPVVILLETNASSHYSPFVHSLPNDFSVVILDLHTSDLAVAMSEAIRSMADR